MTKKFTPTPHDAVFKQFLSEKETAKELPLVFPILFYCGEKSPHPYSTDWLDCFSGRDIAEKIYTKPFKLVDVTTLDDGEIMQHRRIELLELLQKHIRRRDMTELVNEIVKLLSYNYYTDNQVITMFNYLIQEGNAQKPMEFITDIAKQSEKHEGALMTIAQALKQEGRKEGIQEGLQRGKIEGIQEGMQQERIKLAKQFLANGADRNLVKLSTGLSDEDLDKLQNKI